MSSEGRPIAQLLTDFISKERDRFAAKHSNIFALGFSDIVVYRGFLDVIEGRHREASREFRTNTEAMVESVKRGPSSGRLVTPEERQLLGAGQVWSQSIRLETESWYLFAKILLDEVARCIEFYFGQGRKLSLDSHDDLVKHLPGYVELKSLTVVEGLHDQAQTLKSAVSDFRDYQIAHHKSPSTVRGIMLSGNPDESARVAHIPWYPSKAFSQVASGELSEMTRLMDEYLVLVVDFLARNSDKCALEKRS